MQHSNTNIFTNTNTNPFTNTNIFTNKNTNKDPEKKIDLSIVPINYPSLCIPRVFNNVSEEQIKKVFMNLNFGVIQKIDIIQRKNIKEETYKCAFIHFVKWNNNEYVNKQRIKLLLEEELKIMYDQPWYWKISAYRNRNQKILWVPRTPSCSPTITFKKVVKNGIAKENNPKI